MGGATLAGYAEAARRGGQVLVKVDGDDQMDLSYAAQLVAPILLGDADYAKGNRFTSVSHLQQMPTLRVLGNAAVSYLKKLTPEGTAKAAEYIGCAPSFVKTPLRSALGTEPWFPKRGSEPDRL